MKGFKLNATKNNIKNLIIASIIFIVILILFLVIGLRAQVKLSNGNTITQIFVGYSGQVLGSDSQTYGLNMFDSISQLGVSTETKAIFPSAIAILTLGILCFIMSLIGFVLKEQHRTAKMIMDALSKIYFLAIIVLSIIIVAQFSNYVRDYGNNSSVASSASVGALTWAFMIIFGMLFPLIAIAVNFNKVVYFRKYK